MPGTSFGVLVSTAVGRSMGSMSAPGAGLVKHVVIVVKENHTFDNYFGTFPGADGATLPRSPNPPPKDPDHRHSAWLTRATTSVREQFVEADIPVYFKWARKFTLCDNYFTEVAGPSTPNHLMLVSADSPVIDNPPHFQTPAFMLATSVPLSLEQAGLTWRSYGGFAANYLQGVNPQWRVTSAQFKTDAEAGTLPDVSWLFAPSQFNEHPPDAKGSRSGNVTMGSQWTADQVASLVKGGLWNDSVFFVTWDDWGGWYDHVTPPEVETWTGTAVPSYTGTQFRYGSRVGCLVLGPYVKAGYVSKVQHSHVSLPKYCEVLFGLKPLNAHDAAADAMGDCFDFGQPPLPPP